MKHNNPPASPTARRAPKPIARPTSRTAWPPTEARSCSTEARPRDGAGYLFVLLRGGRGPRLCGRGPRAPRLAQEPAHHADPGHGEARILGPQVRARLQGHAGRGLDRRRLPSYRASPRARISSPPPARREGREYAVRREPTDSEWEDMLFGWSVETGITSNSVIYVKDGVTVGVGTGEQDRVGRRRDRARQGLSEARGPPALGADRQALERIRATTRPRRPCARKSPCRAARASGGSVMVSDAFFPFRDGIEVGLREGVAAVVQPGGALRDFESIEACNEYGAAMKFTGQRCFRH